MGEMRIWARRVGEPLKIEAWQIGSCSCGCNGNSSDGRQMIGFDGIIDNTVTVINSVAPTEGRIVWLSDEKRFVMEVTTADNNIEYYASWKGHSTYLPENYDKYVYYIANESNGNSWDMFIIDNDGNMKQVATNGDESLTEEDINAICKM